MPVSINDTAHLTLFSLILMRMSGFILFSPLFGRKNVPNQVKLCLIFVLTLAVYSFSQENAVAAETPFVHGFLLLKEFGIGYVLAFIMELFFFIFTFGGQIIDFQMGLTMATVYDPQFNAQIPVTGGIYQTFFILLFFAVDGHLALMKILLTSAEIVPYGEVIFTAGLAEKLLELFRQCIVLGVKFAFPILAAEFLTEMGVGILNKVVPQVHLLVINMQVKIIVGFALLIVLGVPMGDYLTRMLSMMLKTMQGILTYL